MTIRTDKSREVLEVSRFCSPEMAASLTTPLSPKFSASNGRKPSNKIQRALTAFHQKGNECTRTPILRREILKGLAVIPVTLIINKEPPYSEAREVEVGSYLPPSPTDPSFVFFKASPKDTPALRAGTFYFFCYCSKPLAYLSTLIANLVCVVCYRIVNFKRGLIN